MTNKINLFDRFKMFKVKQMEEQKRAAVEQQKEKITTYIEASIDQEINKLRQGIGYEESDENSLFETAVFSLNKQFLASELHENITAKFVTERNILNVAIEKEKSKYLCHDCPHADINSVDKLKIPVFEGCLIINPKAGVPFKARQWCQQFPWEI